MCKVYTDVGGINWFNYVCPAVPKIIHSLKLANYLHAQEDKPWYIYYLCTALHICYLHTTILHFSFVCLFSCFTSESTTMVMGGGGDGQFTLPHFFLGKLEQMVNNTITLTCN